MKQAKWWLLGFLALFFVTGCTTVAKPGQLAKDWSCKIREMQIKPIFPPREDFQVGDLYLLQSAGKDDTEGYCSPKAAGFYPVPLYVAFLPSVTSLATAHYAARPDFPRAQGATSTITISGSGNAFSITASQGTDVISGSSTFFTVGQANRTRLVGFPDFMSVKIDKASLGAIIPIQGMFTPFGISKEDIDDASISIPVAESYGVPALNAWKAVNDLDGPQKCELRQFVEKMQDAIQNEGGLVPSLRAMGSVPVGSVTSQLELVTEVYYTRAIDVNIQSSSAVSAGIARDKAGDKTLPSTSATSTGLETGTPGQVISAQQTAVNVANGVVKILNARSSVPGVSANFESARSSAISMRRIFDRPVAIGYRSLIITLDAETEPCDDKDKSSRTVGVKPNSFGAQPAFTGL